MRLSEQTYVGYYIKYFIFYFLAPFFKIPKGFVVWYIKILHELLIIDPWGPREGALTLTCAFLVAPLAQDHPDRVLVGPDHSWSKP